MRDLNKELIVELLIVAIAACALSYNIAYKKGKAAGKREAAQTIYEMADEMLIATEVTSPEEAVIEATNDIGSTNIQSMGDGQDSGESLSFSVLRQ